ncbi:hypothetical protein WA026_020192 [Henosepilachna vigintioctopunctata]|uniref:WASH complex subunit strumpellin n=1 Tax=Henosepilachna vigintioctopunctata TaxID=420089 RepID=A0AAW1U2Q8_9CUCU
MSGFLSENNPCSQIILSIVSRGNAIIAELLRLKDYIPKLYITESKNDIDKYQDLIMDFSYFNISEAHESKIEKDEALRDLDEELRDNNIEIITRFYILFESIHTYIIDLNQYIDDLNEGLYIHQSLETVLAETEGKQVLCESLYLYGLMLLLTDVHIKGIIREKLLVSYYRYTPQRSDTQSRIDEVCKLFRDTGFQTKKVQNYPEDYFRRIKLNTVFVDMVIGRLRTDDIYGQLFFYPLPKHRSTALSNQAAMLYICLYFVPNILHVHTAIMREIVDKYFPDNWIISIYMGFTVDLLEVWDSFKAARMALNNTLETSNLKVYANGHGANISYLLKSSAMMLKEGNITKDMILKNMNNIITLLRECNVTLRWMMLHTILKPGKIEKNKRCKQLRDLVILESKYDKIQLFKLLLNTAQLELTVKDLFKTILNEKECQWNELKNESFKSIIELSEVFSGNKPLSRIKKNKNLEKWFLEISKQIDSLVIDDINSSRKIVQLIQALEEVQEFHQLESNMQIIQFLGETRQHLNQMIQTMSITEDNLITLQVIGDISFAWELIDCFTPIMQLGIKREPTLVIKLRAVFLKLASAMEIPLLRINQFHSKDLVSVSEYYSKELEIYVRKVLQIIPNMMFEKMKRIIEIQTTVLKELPTRLDKVKLKEYSQLEERFEFAELTHSISVFSQGMRMMKTTLVGVVCLDPKKILEDGIRNELVQHISKALHTELTFNLKNKKSELQLKINSVGVLMDGYKKSFEYIQDYININGLKIWQEEVTRIINYNVEQECNGFLRLKVHAWDSRYQSRIIPIPLYPPSDSVSKNFIGRLARELMRVTDPKNNVYIDESTSWYDTKYHKSVLTRQDLASLTKAIEIAGVVGLDKLFSCMIVTNLNETIGFLQNKKNKYPARKSIFATIQKEIELSTDVSNPSKFYQNCINRTARLWPQFLDNVLKVGQLQLLRKLLAFHLNLSARFNAKNLEASLQSLSKALMSDMKSDQDWTSEDVLFDLSHYFDYTGINNTFSKIYITSTAQLDYALLLFVFVISYLPKLSHPGALGSVCKRPLDQVDGYSFCLGIHTMFKQFHTNINENFIQFITKYVMDFSSYYRSSKITDPCVEAISAINFLETYSKFSKASDNYVQMYLSNEVKHHELIFPFLNM